MIYDVSSRELTTDAGKLLKKLDCPLHKEWSKLTVLVEDESKRHCESCQKCVVSLAGRKEEEVEALLARSPDCCVYIPPASRTVKITGHRMGMKNDPCPIRRIRTARGEEAINKGAQEGFWPLVKRVKRSPRISSWMEVYQHEETGEIRCVGDWRGKLPPPWQRIIKPFHYYPNPFPDEIAAYLIPSDLKIGERVFLTDLIEDRVSDFGNQDHTYRLVGAYAIWNGKEFKIQWAEWKDAGRWLG